MGRALSARTRFVTKPQRGGSQYPYLRQKLLQLELWTAAYMLDTWESVLLLVILPSVFALGAYLLWDPALFSTPTTIVV